MVWKYEDMPSLEGKVAIVTGATGGGTRRVRELQMDRGLTRSPFLGSRCISTLIIGIGLITATKLAAKGATVVVPGRNRREPRSRRADPQSCGWKGDGCAGGDGPAGLEIC